ncbi:TonB-dependent receptor plug domain-containing protein [Thauera linaloolentis]|uniref:TonB-dependent receptor plug domain-containing protein n=1 Tax=Thauera linaloolentis TaxID=76112 RepID=UPI00048AB60A|nr:TonB-dependent receptor [Thauera linaloolentis]MCM8563979.1 TonB-dependent receptor [Thauera linaloolentis]
MAGIVASCWVPLPASAAEDVLRLLPLSLEELIRTPIITASRRIERRDDTPAHVLVITREQIQARRYRNLGELLSDLPGVDFMPGSRSSIFNNFSVQGFNSNNKLLIMLDGVRIDDPAGGKIAVAHNFSLFMARQVEVVYGPAAALYGADAVAGVVNIITDGQDQPSGGWVSVGGGRFDSREAQFLVRTQPAAARITVGGHVQRSDRAPLDRYYPDDYPLADAKDFDGRLVTPAGSRRRYVDGIESHSLFARADITEHLTLGYYRNGFGQPTSTGDRTDIALYDRDARWETTAETLYARTKFSLGQDMDASLLVDYARQELDPESNYLNIYTGFRERGYTYAKTTRRGIEQSLHWRASERHDVQIGVGYQDYEAILTPNLPRPYRRSLGAHGQGLTYANTDLPIHIPSATYHNVFGYAQWQAGWTPQFTTMIGVRHDRHSGYGSSLNPRLGAVWRPLEQHVFKLAYGEAFRAPSPDESLSAYGAFSGAKDEAGRYLGEGFRAPNERLEAEHARTLSLTWDWRPRPSLNLVAHLYRSHMKNLITTLDEAVPTQYIPGAVLSGTTAKGNAGEEHHTGLDLIGQWQFQAAGAWRGEVWGSLSLIRGDIQEGRDARDWDLPYVATHKLKLGSTWRYGETLTITPRLTWVGDTTTGRKDPARPGRRLETDAYWVASLHVGWHRLLGGRATLWLDVDNLFDRRYHVAHGAASGTLVDMPQQPRSWMATLEYRF